MKKIIKKIAEKAEITEAQAQIAFDVALESFKKKIGQYINVKIDHAIMEEDKEKKQSEFDDKVESFAQEVTETFNNIKDVTVKKFNELAKNFKQKNKENSDKKG